MNTPPTDFYDLLRRVEGAYAPEEPGLLSECVNPGFGHINIEPEGDTLAVFVLRELHDAWLAHNRQMTRECIEEMVQFMESAAQQLVDVTNELYEIAQGVPVSAS